MWSRKYIIGIVCIVAAAIGIAGLVRPVAADIYDMAGNSYVDLDTYLWEKLIASKRFTSSYPNAKSVIFRGTTESLGINYDENYTLTTRETPVDKTEESTSSRNIATAPFQKADEQARQSTITSQPAILQKLEGRNCGPNEEKIQLTVTRTKDQSDTWRHDDTFNLGATITLENTWPGGFQFSFQASTERTWSSGRDVTKTESTSWESGTDVIVPPHQAVKVNFMAEEKIANVRFTHKLRITGETQVLNEERTPIEVCVYEHPSWHRSRYVCYKPSDQVGQPYGAISFFGDLNDTLSSFCVRGNAEVEFFRDFGADGQVWRFREWGNNDPNRASAVSISDDSIVIARDKDRDKDHSGSHPTCYMERDDEIGWWGVGSFDNQISSMRIIDLDQPFVVLYGGVPRRWARSFNAGESVDLNTEFDNRALTIKSSANAKAILYRDRGNQGVYKEIDPGTAEVPIEKLSGQVSSIMVKDTSAGELIDIQDYLGPDDRTVMIQGTYLGQRQTDGHFSRDIALRLTQQDCCGEVDYLDSVDCEPASWAYNMNSFYVTVKVKENGSFGTIKQNGMDCGAECIIAADIVDLPLLWKLEAVPDAGSQFTGWQTETGQPVTGKYRPLPGDTIYAVFEPTPSEASGE